MSRVDLAGKLHDARARVSADRADEQGPPLPMFARLARKETRVREDQYEALSLLARSLMRRRAAKIERITENTLIRVAIDVLLEHQQHLAGGTEVALRDSISSALREHQPPGLTDSEGSGVRMPEPAGLPDVASSAVPDPVGSELPRIRTSGPPTFRGSDVADADAVVARRAGDRGGR